MFFFFPIDFTDASNGSTYFVSISYKRYAQLLKNFSSELLAHIVNIYYLCTHNS